MNLPILLRRFALTACVMCAMQADAVVPGPAPDFAEVRQRLAALSVPFVPNAGQWDARAAFAAQTFAGMLFVTTDGHLVYSLPGKAIDETAAEPANEQPAIHTAGATHRPRQQPARSRGPGGVLTETLVDTNGRALTLAPHGLRRQAIQVSYFIGSDTSRHHGGLATFEQLSLGELSPGIALYLRATGSNVEKIFTVAPARDPGAIRVRVGGVDRLELGPAGELIAHTSNGPVVYTAPIAFQDAAAGQRSAIPVRYALAANKDTYGFALGDYDRSRPLVIDPLLQATYLGGTGGDIITAMAVHPVSGEVLVAGYTLSSDLPGTTNGAQPNSSSASYEGFVARLNANLTSLLQATYLGGSTGGDQIAAMAIHPVSGEVLVAGYATSTDFPATANGAQPAHAANVTGGFDGFVARLNANLTSLLQATYLGGTGSEHILAMAIHPVSGEVLVTGYTNSTNLPCTTIDGFFCDFGAQSTHAADGGADDAFVARLNASLTSLLQATYLGGTDYEQAYAIAIHPVSGEVVVAGITNSLIFPCTTAAGTCAAGGQSTKAADGGSYDGFVARLNANLTILLQATFLGGNVFDQIFAIAIHPVSGEVLVAGETTSFTLPCTTTSTAGCGNGAQPAHSLIANGGFSDGFVARFSANLTRLLQATYLGGSDTDQIKTIAIHPISGEVLVAGYTISTNLPCTTADVFTGCGNGAQAAHAAVGGGQGDDGFVARLNADLTRLLQVTYLGGSRDDLINAIAIHPVSGDVLVAGQTMSSNLPCTTTATPGCANGAQTTNAVGTGTVDDGFVARLSVDLTLNDNIPNSFAFTPQSNVALSSVRTSDPVLIAGIVGAVNLYVDGQPGSTYCESSTNACTCDISVGFIETGATSNNRYVCVRHTASAALNELTKTVLHIGGAAAPFVVTTGALIGGNCALDVDGNNNVDALTDGLMLLRAMFGLTGTAVTNGAVGGGATRSTWAQIRPFLNGNCSTSFAP